MEQGYGGPVWHVSISSIYPVSTAVLSRRARQEIEGLGDASLGEWTEMGRKAFHLRRRLSAHEAASVGPVVDIRGTREAMDRLDRVRQWLPAGWAESPSTEEE